MKKVAVKHDLVRFLALEHGGLIEDYKPIVESMLNFLSFNLGRGNEVHFRKFGHFKPVLRAEKKGQNIAQRTTVVIPANYSVKFCPSDDLKEFINKNLARRMQDAS